MKWWGIDEIITMMITYTKLITIKMMRDWWNNYNDKYYYKNDYNKNDEGLMKTLIITMMITITKIMSTKMMRDWMK